jgi:hypothetical protein
MLNLTIFAPMYPATIFMTIATPSSAEKRGDGLTTFVLWLVDQVAWLKVRKKRNDDDDNDGTRRRITLAIDPKYHIRIIIAKGVLTSFMRGW